MTWKLGCTLHATKVCFIGDQKYIRIECLKYENMIYVWERDRKKMKYIKEERERQFPWICIANTQLLNITKLFVELPRFVFFGLSDCFFFLPWAMGNIYFSVSIVAKNEKHKRQNSYRSACLGYRHEILNILSSPTHTKRKACKLSNLQRKVYGC